MSRNIWRYCGGVGLLLAMGPRTFAWRRWCWATYLPWAQENPVLQWWRNWVLFTLRYPRLTWFRIRLWAHYALGAPKPPIEGETHVHV